MRPYLRIAIIALLIFAPLLSNAQRPFHFVWGVNVSTISLKLNGVNYSTEAPAGIHLGGLFELPLSKNFVLEPGFKFSAKGTDYTIDSSYISLAPIYIEIPLNTSFRINFPNSDISVFAGPYLACAIGGYKIESGLLQDIRYGSGENDDLRYFDFGFNFGAGIRYKFWKLSVQYGIGLANILPARVGDSEMKNTVIGISLVIGGKTQRI
jgi:hypothetical protein